MRDPEKNRRKSSPEGRIISEPKKTPVYLLDDLLDRMTPETFHEEIDSGPPIGHEIW